ncbi:hypothetical protein ACQPXM_13750 [Kribbella sp. CA-253562]|uniref:hypothetical protein n=1 Tax=Kribbella sp. CA-253562 TaxID=3239942 RepID=UPI003D93D703
MTEPTQQVVQHDDEIVVNRGSLHRRFGATDDWDSPETNADIARDFGITGPRTDSRTPTRTTSLW